MGLIIICRVSSVDTRNVENSGAGESKSFADGIVDSLRQKGYEIPAYDNDSIKICAGSGAQLGTLYLNHDCIRPLNKTPKDPDSAKAFINENERWFLVLGTADGDLSYRVREIAGEISGGIEVHVLSPNETPDFNRTGGINLFDDTF